MFTNMVKFKMIPVLLLFIFVPKLYSAPVQDEQHEIVSFDEGQSDGCMYNLLHYKEGQRIITNEPCLNCTCHDRMLRCYLRVCPFIKAIGQECIVERGQDQCCPKITCPEVPVPILTSTSTEKSPSDIALYSNKYSGCSINERWYSNGEKIEPHRHKPCEICYCIRNQTACIMQECTLNVPGCKPVYKEGFCCPVKYECDERLLLGETNETSSNALSSTLPPLLLTTTINKNDPGCFYKGHQYDEGALIESDEACEHCYCMKGNLVCAVRNCGAPLENHGNCRAVPNSKNQCCPETYECDNVINSMDPYTKANDSFVNRDLKDPILKPILPLNIFNNEIPEDYVREILTHVPDAKFSTQGYAKSTEYEIDEEPPKDNVIEDETVVENTSNHDQRDEISTVAYDDGTNDHQQSISTLSSVIEESKIDNNQDDNVKIDLNDLSSSNVNVNEIGLNHSIKQTNEETSENPVEIGHTQSHIDTETKTEIEIAPILPIENLVTEKHTELVAEEEPVKDIHANKVDKDHKDVPESSPDPHLVHKIDIEQPTNYDHENGMKTPSSLNETVEANRLVPGEGSCLVEKDNYQNNSYVPVISRCQLWCKCISSIVHCESVTCPEPPEEFAKCSPIMRNNECCPIYACDDANVQGAEIHDISITLNQIKPVTNSPNVTDNESDNSNIKEDVLDEKVIHTTTETPDDRIEQTEVSTQNNLQSEYANVEGSTQSEDIGTQTDNYNLLDSSTSSSTDKYVTEQIDTTDNTDVSSHSAQELENNVETSTKSTEIVEITTTLNEIDNNLDSKTEMIETYETESDRETVNPTTESYSSNEDESNDPTEEITSNTNYNSYPTQTPESSTKITEITENADSEKNNELVTEIPENSRTTALATDNFDTTTSLEGVNDIENLAHEEKGGEYLTTTEANIATILSSGENNSNLETSTNIDLSDNTEMGQSASTTTVNDETTTSAYTATEVASNQYVPTIEDQVKDQGQTPEDQTTTNKIEYQPVGDTETTVTEQSTVSMTTEQLESLTMSVTENQEVEQSGNEENGKIEITTEKIDVPPSTIDNQITENLTTDPIEITTRPLDVTTTYSKIDTSDNIDLTPTTMTSDLNILTESSTEISNVTTDKQEEYSTETLPLTTTMETENLDENRTTPKTEESYVEPTTVILTTNGDMGTITEDVTKQEQVITTTVQYEIETLPTDKMDVITSTTEDSKTATKPVEIALTPTTNQDSLATTNSGKDEYVELTSTETPEEALLTTVKDEPVMPTTPQTPNITDIPITETASVYNKVDNLSPSTSSDILNVTMSSHEPQTEQTTTISNKIDETEELTSSTIKYVTTEQSLYAILNEHDKVTTTAESEVLVPAGDNDDEYDDLQLHLGPGTCRYSGKIFVSAQQIPRDNPCDFCFCFRGDIICLEQKCPPPIRHCRQESIEGYCCPRFECPVLRAIFPNSTTTTSTTTTTTTTTLRPRYPYRFGSKAHRKGCQFRGKSYEVNEEIKSASGPCLNCICGGDGQMQCNPKVCSPGPTIDEMIQEAYLNSNKKR